MGWLKSLLGGKPSSGSTITLRHPLVIENPRIAFLNLIESGASPLVDEDVRALKPLFSQCLNGDSDVPVCDILMIYATIRPDGRVENKEHSLREIIHKSHAPIVVVATENSAESYIAAAKRSSSDKANANLVMTLKRNGQSFPDFFKELFGMMYHGTTMPMAWVKLAPQIPGEQKNVPGTICAMEVSHILFK
jgi:hypothetical protein